MKWLLVRPKFISLVANLEPLGLEYVAGMLRDLKVPYEIFDEFQRSPLFRYARLKRKIKVEGFSHVGFNANANTVDYILSTAKKLKADFPRLVISVGGPETELNYRDFCADGVDYVFHDNSLASMHRIVQSGCTLNVLRQETGVCFRDGGEWVVREKGAPASDLFCKPDRSELYRHIKRNFIFCKGSYAIVKGSFSCPFRCSFCYCTKMNSGVYTERRLSDIIDEIKEIDHERIWFVDDTFLLSKDRVVEFCTRVIEEGIHKQFMAYSRADFLAEHSDILPLLYQAGFRDILVGLEAVSDDFLDAYHKDTTKDINEAAIRNLRENHLVCNGLFVVSHTSTKEDFRALIRFIRKNKLLWMVFGIFTPYKGTDAYDEYKDRLVNYTSARLDGIHITIKPEHMSSFMFMLRFYWLHVLTYPKVIFRAWRKTAYDTEKNGWL